MGVHVDSERAIPIICTIGCAPLWLGSRAQAKIRHDRHTEEEKYSCRSSIRSRNKPGRAAETARV